MSLIKADGIVLLLTIDFTTLSVSSTSFDFFGPATMINDADFSSTTHGYFVGQTPSIDDKIGN